MARKSMYRVSGNLMPEKKVQFDTIIHVSENWVYKLVGKTLHISQDYGVSYTQILNFSSKLNEIRFIHRFSNGTLLIGDHTRLAYTTDNTNLTYTDVKNLNGTTYVPAIQFDNFTLVNGSNIQKMNNGTKEVFMWGNYNNSENDSMSPNCFIWYTEDFGKTVKCIFHFGESIPVNKTDTLYARHVHNVEYNPKDNTFWFCTGDEPMNINANWVQVKPNTSSSTGFDFYWINTGAPYQVSNLVFVDDWIYASLDTSGGGLVRIKYSEASDPTKFEHLKTGLNDVLFIYVKNNKAIIVQSRWKGTQEGRRFWYSPNIEGSIWHEIYGDMPEGYTGASIYCRVYYPNSKGMILSGIQMNFNQGFHLYNFTPSVWLNDILDKNGFKDAFK